MYSSVTILSLFVLAYVLREAYRLFSNLFLHPLTSFPGPKAAAATYVYQQYFEVLKRPGGQYMFEIDRLHEEHGAE